MKRPYLPPHPPDEHRRAMGAVDLFTDTTPTPTPTRWSSTWRSANSKKHISRTRGFTDRMRINIGRDAIQIRKKISATDLPENRMQEIFTTLPFALVHDRLCYRSRRSLTNRVLSPAALSSLYLQFRFPSSLTETRYFFQNKNLSFFPDVSNRFLRLPPPNSFSARISFQNTSLIKQFSKILAWKQLEEPKVT